MRYQEKLQEKLSEKAHSTVERKKKPQCLCPTALCKETRLNDLPGGLRVPQTASGMSASGRVCAGWSPPCCSSHTHSRQTRRWCPSARPTAQLRCGCKRQLIVASAVRLFCEMLKAYLLERAHTLGISRPGTSSFGEAEGQGNHLQTATGPCTHSLCRPELQHFRMRSEVNLACVPGAYGVTRSVLQSHRVPEDCTSSSRLTTDCGCVPPVYTAAARAG